jgi:predicted 3-demethylubiquinone-9 3-methyltransferase (glyoxalase superfamily)
MASLQKISPFLWFNDNAEQAIQHYISIFRHAKIIASTRYGDAGPGPKGALMTATFQLEGVEFMALNGGPHFKFTEAISLLVRCESQNEVDYLWEQLGAGGQPGQCGWLKDKFGLSWQIVPVVLMELLQDRDPEKAARVTQAMLQMGKIDISRLQQAYNG